MDRREDKMRSLTLLKERSAEIQAEIKELLLDNYRFDHSINRQLNVITTVITLRNELSDIQREIRERLSA